MTRSRYDDYPGHPLYGVPEELLEVAREVMREAAMWKDVNPDYADALGDSVVAELLEAGYRITGPRMTIAQRWRHWRRGRQLVREYLQEWEACKARHGIHLLPPVNVDPDEMPPSAAIK